MPVFIGTSGWSYDHWQGILYPRGADSLQRLDAYAARFRTVEVNNTFYRWPRPEVFDRWRERVPPGFVFSIKASRGLTHIRRLNDPASWIERMEEGLVRLREAVGVLLVQLPPQFGFHPDRLDNFLARVPRGRKVACEFRHPSWQRPETFAILERRRAAYCVMSGPGLPCVPRATANFAFVRLHGSDTAAMYAGCYSAADLLWWSERIQEWAEQGRDVYVYFNNDGFGHAVRNAERLAELLGTLWSSTKHVEGRT